MALRDILLSCDLKEEYKWRQPCYTNNGKNIVTIQAFSQYFGLLFFKGVLLSDNDNMLIKMGKNTRIGRQLRFNNASEIREQSDLIKKYVEEAIDIERKGLIVDIDKALILPSELKETLKNDPELKEAFDRLTPGRQNGYVIYISGAKRPATRISRIEKCRANIMAGKGYQGR